MKVYLLESDGFYKIGVAANTSRRIKELQTGNPHKINLVAECEIRDGSEFRVERYILTIFHALNVSGEWFRLVEDHVSLLRETFILLENNDFSSLEIMSEKWIRVYDRISRSP